jgi:cysteinyl-tRNA synthetase
VTHLHVYRDRFIEAMDDDFNTADADSVIIELAREANAATTPEKAPSKALAGALLDLFDELTGVLGLLYGDEEDKSLAEEVEALIAARQAARKEKNWPEADRIRDKIKALGIILEDTPQGVKWKKA